MTSSALIRFDCSAVLHHDVGSGLSFHVWEFTTASIDEPVAELEVVCCQDDAHTHTRMVTSLWMDFKLT